MSNENNGHRNAALVRGPRTAGGFEVQAQKPDPGHVKGGRGAAGTANTPVATAAEVNARGQRGEGQRGEGQRGDGQRGDGQRGDGQRGDGQRGDGHRGDGHRGAGQRAKAVPAVFESKRRKQLTRFERAHVIRTRATAIASGAPVLLKDTHGCTDPLYLAEQELESRLLVDYVVRKCYPDATYEEFALYDLAHVHR